MTIHNNFTGHDICTVEEHEQEELVIMKEKLGLRYYILL